MKKNGYFSLLIISLVIGLYNLVMFLVPFEHSTAFWWAYGATMLALALQYLFGWLGFRNSSAETKLFGISVAYVGYVYALIQLIVGFVFVLLQPVAWLCALTFSALLIVIIILTVIALVGTQYAETPVPSEDKVFYIKSLQVQLEIIATKAENALVKQEVKKLVDAVKYSDPVSHPSLQPMEEKLREQVAELAEAVELKEDAAAKGLVRDISILLTERNQTCKILK